MVRSLVVVTLASFAGVAAADVPTRTLPVDTIATAKPGANTLKRKIQKFHYCYEKALLVTSSLAGTVTATFTLTTAGTVSDSTASGVDPDVSDCAATSSSRSRRSQAR